MTIRNFDVLNVELKGKNLIEASAGTGKTFSIAIIFMRWILETDNSVDSIAAVTYTEFATKELKERISSFLKDALDFMLHRENCSKNIDEKIKFVCENALKNVGYDDSVKKLKSAVSNFEETSIYTIHGFCNRLITENAFELNVDSDIKIAEDGNTKYRDITLDFFRKKLINRNFTADELEKTKFDDLLGFIKKIGFATEKLPDILSDRSSICGDLWNFAKNDLRQRHQKTSKVDFDDLLLIVYEALQDKASENTLQNVMKKRYSLILIDEFQDTDPVQAFIFKKLFCENNYHTVFFIGDPKQSIYSFRNADIFSYLNLQPSKTEAGTPIIGNKYAMDKNFRSYAAPVEAVNRLFEHRNSFGIKEIEYTEIYPNKTRTNSLTIGGQPAPGILVCKTAKEKKDRIEELLANHIRENIFKMIAENSEYRLDGKPISPADIAVLTTENKYALKIHKKLTEIGIPSSIEPGTGKEFSVFYSKEANVLFKLVKAAETKGMAEFKALLLTFFYKKSVDDLMENPDSAIQLFEEFSAAFSEWENIGFYSSFLNFLKTGRFLENMSGEGVETVNNINHLLELINIFETENSFIPQKTAEWFTEKMNCTVIAGNEYLRTETEEREAVKIMTLHKSKGLEFKIVFFPFILKNEQRNTKNWYFYHQNDGENGYISKISDKKTESDMLKDAELELEREFYVGVTRAACMTVCYAFDSDEFGILFPVHKFLQNGESPYIQFEQLETEENENSLKRNDAETATLRNPEEIGKEIKTEWAVSSFSGIVSSGNRDSFAGEDDNGETLHDFAQTPLLNDLHEGGEVLETALFPRGTQPGTLLHAIFEKADFVSDDNRETIREILKSGINCTQDELENYVEIVNSCIKEVASVPIFGNRMLKEVKPQDKIAEMEFFLKISSDMEKGKLAELIDKISKTPQIYTDSLQKGFLHGFIDLTLKIDGKYYIVDWKSNYLGDFIEDYSENKILAAMQKHNYFLQYMLYLAALDKYLSRVDKNYSYSSNFGGIRYIFLRGVKADSPESGIFKDLPDEKTVRQIQELFEVQL